MIRPVLNKPLSLIYCSVISILLAGISPNANAEAKKDIEKLTVVGEKIVAIKRTQ